MSMIRAYELTDGDVIEVLGCLMQYENGLFYEVKYGGLDEFMQTIWIRTGRTFTTEELNKIIMEV
jgi:hypothetical protein